MPEERLDVGLSPSSATRYCPPPTRATSARTRSPGAGARRRSTSRQRSSTSSQPIRASPAIEYRVHLIGPGRPSSYRLVQELLMLALSHKGGGVPGDCVPPECVGTHHR